MEEGTVDASTAKAMAESNPDLNGGGDGAKKVVVVMGATGAGKSRLAVDLAPHFAGVEIVNADSMQVYRGLDVLTNKLPLAERKGVPHHLLGTIDASVEFTSKDFRDLAVPILEDISSRNCLPIVVGGTNYYIQALVSPFLVDDVVTDMATWSLNDTVDEIDLDRDDPTASFERLKKIDPVAANRIHPNDHRKTNRYLSLYASSGVVPSNLFQAEAAKKWGRADNSRYDCCFIWVDASLSVLDRYVNQRVDCMIDAGLLNEVCDIYNPNADYTRGLRQAIGVREFEGFFRCYFACVEANKASRPDFSEILSSDNDNLKLLLTEAIEKLKANTRKLVRRQKRRLNRLKTYFGWELHYIDATEAFCCIPCDAEDLWQKNVVEPCVNVVRKFLIEKVSSLPGTAAPSDDENHSLVARDLWTQYVCEACGNQILRGAHEWEQHKQGRGHRKRVARLKKKHLNSYSAVSKLNCDGFAEVTERRV